MPKPVRVNQLAYLPMALAGAGAVCAWLLAILKVDELDHVTITFLAVAGALSAASVFFFRFRLTNEEVEIKEAKNAILEEKLQLESFRAAVQDDAAIFEKRRQQFEARLMTYHEWMEFPNVEMFTPLDDHHEKAHALEREVMQLTQQAADQILVNLRTDKYSEDGKFAPRLLMRDTLDFVTTIARVYQPNAKEPLLETSVETLLKSVNHVTLQLLFQLEQLPMNVKEFSLAKIYDHTRTASRIYGAYKSVSPYLTYGNYTWQIGKIFMGANPILTGTWMLGSEIFRRTSQKISKHYIDRYSLRLLSDAIRIIANETARTFDSKHRYRDPNWVYGVELAELVYQFPLSRETLQQALTEIGHLPLRNSYDRIFLYRCVAAGKSPRPDGLIRNEILGVEQRRQIVERLENFFRHHVHGRRKDRVDAWSEAATKRLGMPLRVAENESQSVSEHDYATALTSLGAFLTAVKERPPEKIREPLQASETALHFSNERFNEVIDEMIARPAVFFDFPDLDPGNPIVPCYMRDLIQLEAAEMPQDLQGFWAIREISDYFREPRKQIEDQLTTAYRNYLSKEIVPDSPEASIPNALSLALVRILDKGEMPRFVYPKPAPEGESEGLGIRFLAGPAKHTRWLVGTNARLFVVESRDGLDLDDYNRFHIVWSAGNTGAGQKLPLRLERLKGMMTDHVVMRFGIWGPESEGAQVTEAGLRVPGDRMKRFGVHFGPLRQWLKFHGLDFKEEGQ